MTRTLTLLLIAGCALGAANTRADEDLPYLATIAIDWAPGATRASGDTLDSTLHVNDAARSLSALSAIDGIEILTSDEDAIRIRYRKRPTIASGIPEDFLESSWVVDFDEASVRALIDSMPGAAEAQPMIKELERFVYDHIVDKTYSRAFDLASRVAASGRGDCTEHAVLLAALARAFDHPARVVFGNLVLQSRADLYAFGHAWTEIHDGEKWQIHDATLPGNDTPDVRVRYIPLGLLRDEGPGYPFSLMEVVDAMPSRISGVAAP